MCIQGKNVYSALVLLGQYEYTSYTSKKNRLSPVAYDFSSIERSKNRFVFPAGSDKLHSNDTLVEQIYIYI